MWNSYAYFRTSKKRRNNHLQNRRPWILIIQIFKPLFPACELASNLCDRIITKQKNTTKSKYCRYKKHKKKLCARVNRNNNKISILEVNQLIVVRWKTLFSCMKDDDDDRTKDEFCFICSFERNSCWKVRLKTLSRRHTHTKEETTSKQ